MHFDSQLWRPGLSSRHRVIKLRIRIGFDLVCAMDCSSMRGSNLLIVTPSQAKSFSFIELYRRSSFSRTYFIEWTVPGLLAKAICKILRNGCFIPDSKIGGSFAELIIQIQFLVIMILGFWLFKSLIFWKIKELCAVSECRCRYVPVWNRLRHFYMPIGVSSFFHVWVQGSLTVNSRL